MDQPAVKASVAVLERINVDETERRFRSLEYGVEVSRTLSPATRRKRVWLMLLET